MGSPDSTSRLGTHPGSLSLFVKTPISAALRADGFGENPFYHCLVAEILPDPGESQGKNTPTSEVHLSCQSQVSSQPPNSFYFFLFQSPVLWAMGYTTSYTAHGRDATYIWKIYT